MRPVIWLDKDSPSVDLRPKGMRIEGKRIKIRGGMCEGYEFLREKGRKGQMALDRQYKTTIERQRERQRVIDIYGERETDRDRETETEREIERERERERERVGERQRERERRQFRSITFK